MGDTPISPGRRPCLLYLCKNRGRNEIGVENELGFSYLLANINGDVYRYYFVVSFDLCVYKLWDCIKIRRQKEISKYNLSIEIADNLKRLENYRRTIDKVTKGDSKSRILYSYFHLQTILYKAALQNGAIYNLRDEKLQKDLYEYATKCECFNWFFSEAKVMSTAKFGINSDIPKEVVETFVGEALPDLKELIVLSDKLQKSLLGESLSEVNSADK